jgi:hypothetical protein
MRTVQVTNRLGWCAEKNTGWDTRVTGEWLVCTIGATVIKDGFATQADAEAFIAVEIAARNIRNARSRARHAAMTGLGMVRNRNGSYE